MQKNPSFARRLRCASLVLACAFTAPNCAAQADDETAAIRKPLPEIAAPVEADEDATVFSTEAPPPPPLDAGEQAPAAGEDPDKR